MKKVKQTIHFLVLSNKCCFLLSHQLIGTTLFWHFNACFLSHSHFLKWLYSNVLSQTTPLTSILKTCLVQILLHITTSKLYLKWHTLLSIPKDGSLVCVSALTLFKDLIYLEKKRGCNKNVLFHYQQKRNKL